MAILYRSFTVWNCAFGHAAGGDHLATGELYRGFIYYRDIESVGGLTRLDIHLSNGTTVRLHNDQVTAGDNIINIHRRGHTQDGYTILEVEPKTVRDFVGVRSVDVQAYYRTSDHDYNALSKASFNLWDSSASGGEMLATGTSKNIFDNRVDHAWYNDMVSIDGEVLTFKPHAGDRLVTFSFHSDIMPDGAGGDPFVSWALQLKRSDNTLIASSPSMFLTVSGAMKCRQIDLTAYIRGDDDPLVTQGVIPIVTNTGSNPIKFEDAKFHVYTVDTPSNPYLLFNGK